MTTLEPTATSSSREAIPSAGNSGTTYNVLEEVTTLDWHTEPPTQVMASNGQTGQQLDTSSTTAGVRTSKPSSSLSSTATSATPYATSSSYLTSLHSSVAPSLTGTSQAGDTGTTYNLTTWDMRTENPLPTNSTPLSRISTTPVKPSLSETSSLTTAKQSIQPAQTTTTTAVTTDRVCIQEAHLWGHLCSCQ